jgi:hypothetical protein
MSQGLEDTTQPFIDRRFSNAVAAVPGVERRQFSNSYDDLSPRVRELALAIDEYKLVHRRRFITYQEMIEVIEGLGYHK